jgi:WD40 repeat protein
MTWNPGGDRLLVSANEGLLSLWNTHTGQKMMDVPTALLDGYGATCPDWSPDGTQIAVSLAPQVSFDADWATKSGSIAIIPYNGGNFGPPSVVVGSSTEIHSCPSFSPDGKWLAFVSAPPAGQYMDSSQNPRSHLQLVSTHGGPVYDLANASQQGKILLGTPTSPELGAYSTWPKFAPYLQQDGDIMFVTFHSRIDYGFVLPNHLAPTAADLSNSANPQLWFAAIDVSKLGEGGDPDPSYAPAWLPLQDVTDRNHLGFWTEKIGCTVDAQCGNNGRTNCDKCAAGQCVGVACIVAVE